MVDAESLPKYLFQESLSFEREQEALVPYGGLDRARAVLKVLAESAKGAGRRRILEKLASQGPALTRTDELHLFVAAAFLETIPVVPLISEWMAGLILGEALPVDLSAYAPGRFAAVFGTPLAFI